MSRDTMKLFLLAFLYVACLATLWTSTTSVSGSTRPLRPQLHRFCKASRQKLQSCRSDEPCGKEASVCEAAVHKAYRHINMAGCPDPMQGVADCENEWCGRNASGSDCKQECMQIRAVLDECVQKHVYSFLNRHGLTAQGLYQTNDKTKTEIEAAESASASASAS